MGYAPQWVRGAFVGEIPRIKWSAGSQSDLILSKRESNAVLLTALNF